MPPPNSRRRGVPSTMHLQTHLGGLKGGSRRKEEWRVEGRAMEWSVEKGLPQVVEFTRFFRGEGWCQPTTPVGQRPLATPSNFPVKIYMGIQVTTLVDPSHLRMTPPPRTTSGE